MASSMIKPSSAGHIWEYGTCFINAELVVNHEFGIAFSRICMPMTVEEYHIGQLWSVAEASKNETGGGEGLEVLINEPFDEVNHKPVTPLEAGGKRYTEGQFTKKIYHLKSKVPSFIRVLAPKGSLAIYEEAWNAYPYCRTVITNPDYMKENFFIIIESFHASDSGDSPNIHQLTDQELKKREVHQVDISQNYEEYKHDYKPEHDPTLVKSEKTGRGPLPKAHGVKGQQGAWALTHEPVMCCYKLVRAYFKYFMIQNRVEKFIMKQEKRLFYNFHRQVYCWMDKWHGLTLEDIRGIERATKNELDEKRKQGDVQGTKASEN